jgi:hypothetical protein
MKILKSRFAAMFASAVLLPVISTSAVAAPAAQQATQVTAAEYLASQPKPHFRPGHTFPRLTRYGWEMPFDTKVELAGNWGYALEWTGGYATQASVEAQLSKPDSIGSKLCALAAKEPDKYPLSVTIARDMPKPGEVPDATWVRDASGKFTDGKNVWGVDGQASWWQYLWSPAAPDDAFIKAAAWRADPLRLLRERAPIAIVLNGGEYGLGMPGAHLAQWEKDPDIVKAKGERSWYEFASQSKGRQELIIARAVREAVPERQLYIYYNTGYEIYRNSNPTWMQWSKDFKELRHASDLPSIEWYYRNFNNGWTGDRDGLSMILNAIGYQITYGAPLSYNWVTSGWPRKDLGQGAVSDTARYIGFLKCFYTAGMIGGNAGYYSYPEGGFQAPFAKDAPPNWLEQMTALSHVHALFSYLERFSRDGYLVPGPDRHKWSKDQPAYELPTGQPNTRVLARKMKLSDEWIITAWAADGTPREVTVTVPVLGEVKLQARAADSVYYATIKDGKSSLTLLDEDALQPTVSASSLKLLAAVATPQSL